MNPMPRDHAAEARKEIQDRVWAVWATGAAPEGVLPALLDLSDAEGLEPALGAALSVLIAAEQEEARLKALADQAAATAKAAAAATEAVRAILQQVIEDTGAPEAATAFHTACVEVRGGGVVVTDIEALPAEFVKTKKEADKAALKKAFQKGRIVKGATMDNGRPTLVVRAKAA